MLRVLLLVVSRIHGIKLSLLGRSSANLGIGAAALLQMPIAVCLIVALLSAQARPLLPPPPGDHLPLCLLPQAASPSAVDPERFCSRSV